MNAHVEQVGGDHYQAGYQHWDWSAETGLGCLEYAATKYVTRWRKKDGVQGLKKAITYLQKIKALGITYCPPAFNRPMRSDHRRYNFLKSNDINLESNDAVVITMIDCWMDHDDIDRAIHYLEKMIDAYEAVHA